MHLSNILSAALLSSVALAAPLEATRFEDTLVKRQGSGSVNNAEGLSFYDATLTDGTAGYPDANTYNCYSGPATNFPARTSWMAFSKMWPLLENAACIPIGDSQAEAQDIYNGILKISSVAKVDARVILAVIILESTGNVRVKCTTSSSGVPNCGLMQSHNGTSYHPAFPVVSITQMIRDGTQGTAYGPGLVQYFNDNPNTFVTTGGNLWKVLRGYNSGVINSTNLSNSPVGSPSYVSDIANYLQGWHGYGNNSATQNCGF